MVKKPTQHPSTLFKLYSELVFNRNFIPDNDQLIYQTKRQMSVQGGFTVTCLFLKWVIPKKDNEHVIDGVTKEKLYNKIINGKYTYHFQEDKTR
jgi:hypothetical protein